MPSRLGQKIGALPGVEASLALFPGDQELAPPGVESPVQLSQEVHRGRSEDPLSVGMGCETYVPGHADDYEKKCRSCREKIIGTCADCEEVENF